MVHCYLIIVFLLILFFRVPVPGRAGVRHSGFNTETRQNKFLQNDPENYKTYYNKYIHS